MIMFYLEQSVFVSCLRFTPLFLSPCSHGPFRETSSHTQSSVLGDASRYVQDPVFETIAQLSQIGDLTTLLHS